MHGTIQVKSTPNIGSVFTVMFPVSKPSENSKDKSSSLKKSIPSTLSQGNNMYKILLVEDEKVSQSVTVMALKKFCTVDVADSGDSAIALAKQNKYDLILMDINLGRGLTGLETAQQIKNMVEYHDIAIIALTAYAMRGDKEDFIAQGCTHYLSKPFNINELVGMVKSILIK